MRGKKMRGEKSRANTPAGHQFPSGNWFSQLDFFFWGGRGGIGPSNPADLVPPNVDCIATAVDKLIVDRN